MTTKTKVLEFSILPEWLKIEYQDELKVYRVAVPITELKEIVKPFLQSQKQEIREVIEGERIRIINELKKVECNFCGNKQPIYGCACGGYMKALSDILEKIKSLWQQKRKIYN